MQISIGFFSLDSPYTQAGLIINIIHFNRQVPLSAANNSREGGAFIPADLQYDVKH